MTRRHAVFATCVSILLTGIVTLAHPALQRGTLLQPPGAPPPQPLSAGDVSPFADAIRRGDLDAIRALAKTTDVNAPERRGGATPLMLAAAFGSVDVMRTLIELGAKVNATSYGRATPLMWGISDPAKVRLLIDKGADVNAVSELGRNAIFLAAFSDRSADTVRLLLARGANARIVDDVQKMTVLHAAAFGNDAATLKLILDAGVDVNAADITGSTALMYATANGNLESAKLLLARGANVNAVSGPPGATVKNGTIALGQFTPLILASTYGPHALVRVLIDAGANVNVTDARGMTPLMYAVTADHGDPAIAKALLAAGAKTDVRSGLGETALDWATKGAMTSHVAALKSAGAPTGTARPVSTRSTASRAASVNAAVERSVGLLERSSGTFFVNGGCGACHSHNITDIAVGEARRAGVKVDEAGSAQRLAGAAAQFGSTATRFLERIDGPAVDITMYVLAGFAGGAYPPDRATDALTANILAQQAANGSWHRGFIARPPTADGDVSITALGIRAVQRYGPPSRRAELDERVKRAAAWLRGAKVLNAEDRAYRTLGLRWAGAPSSELRRYAREMLDTQRPDGGWAQRAGLDSDAYATGLTLYALVQANMPPSDAALQRAVQFLVNSQRADGSWYVASRSPKFQPYFDGGFPYEHDQWISMWGTGWATAALASTIQPQAGKAAQ